ncbi:unnamed protein product [Cuscuta europaea]|uniref:Ubiquitin-like-conjugating enzyme ATG10 n=1 Tax=Cuscuta europaea TaxID=41803 RepID=A0A9P1E2F3_CUSEU|nr:unnamed protein product [Cuscuta europaea]
MGAFHLESSTLLLVHLVSNGRSLTLLFLNGHGADVQSFLGLLPLEYCPTPIVCLLFLVNAIKVDGYLCVDGVVPPPASTMEDNHEYDDGIIKETGCLEEDDIIDSAALVQPQRCERCRYDFHIVYSLSYRVPVLYFRAYWSDGQPLALQELEKNIPESTRQELTVHKWTFITQEVTRVQLCTSNCIYIL